MPNQRRCQRIRWGIRWGILKVIAEEFGLKHYILRMMETTTSLQASTLTNGFSHCGPGIFHRFAGLLPCLIPACDEPDVDILFAEFILHRSADRAAAHAIDHDFAAPELLPPLCHLLGVLPFRPRNRGRVALAVRGSPHVQSARRILFRHHLFQLFRCHDVVH
jgi:hypothetical protein